MYYAHPLISYPSYPSSSFTEMGLSQSPVSERKNTKGTGCNDILLTLLFSLYGALHLAVAVLALFLIQVSTQVLAALQIELGVLMSFCFSFLEGREI